MRSLLDIDPEGALVRSPEIREQLLVILDQNQKLKHNNHSLQDELVSALRQLQLFGQSLRNQEKYAEALQVGNQKHMVVISNLQRELSASRKEADERRVAIGEKDNQIFRLNLTISSLNEKVKQAERQCENRDSVKEDKRKIIESELENIRREMQACSQRYHSEHDRLQNCAALLQQLEMAKANLLEDKSILEHKVDQVENEYELKCREISQLSRSNAQLQFRERESELRVRQLEKKLSLLGSYQDQWLELQEAERAKRLRVRTVRVMDCSIEFRESQMRTKELEHQLQRQQLELEKALDMLADKEQLIEGLQQRISEVVDTAQTQIEAVRNSYQSKLEAVASKICQLQDLEEALSESEQKVRDLRYLLSQTEFARDENSRLAKQNSWLKAELDRHKKNEVSLQLEADRLRQTIERCERELKGMEVAMFEEIRRKAEKENKPISSFKLGRFLDQVESVRSKGLQSSRSNQSRSNFMP